MDPSIAIFVVGSCVSFFTFYWVFNRRLAAAQTRRQAEQARRHGLRKLCFLDDLRHEAGLRAQTVLSTAADQVSKTPINADMLMRLTETRSMLQPLLPSTFLAEFDHIVRLLNRPPALRGSDLDSAFDRLARHVKAIATAPDRRPVRAPARLRWPSLRISLLRTAGDVT